MNRSLAHVAVVLWTAASLIVSPVFAQAQQNQVTARSAEPETAPIQDQQGQDQQGQTSTPPQQQTPPATTGQQSAPSTAAGPVSAKTLNWGRDYSKGKSLLPDPFAPYSPINVEEPNLTNTPKIDSLIQDGKLNLSLDDAISLA